MPIARPAPPSLAPEEPRKESGTFAAARVDLRAAALAWMAAKDTWHLSDLVGWGVAALVEPGLLVSASDDDPLPYFWERDVGLVRNGPAHAAPAARIQAGGFTLRPGDVPRMLAVAHARVRGALRGLIERNANDAFVHAAIYAGRVYRDAGRWNVRLTSDMPMSDQVLALFAADLLASRDDYDRALTVCEECGAVGFEHGLPHWRRFGCARHPDPLRSEEIAFRR